MGSEAPGDSPSPSSSLVRVVTGHVVSSSSMVSRAYLADSWRGIVTVDGDGRHWLVCTLDALAPDEADLLIRGEEECGLPREYARATLTKIVIAWIGAGGPNDEPIEVTIANPRVVRHPAGASIGAVALDRSKEFVQHVDAGTAPCVHALTSAAAVPDGYTIETLLDVGDGVYWPVSRLGRRSSISGDDFLGQRGASALEVALADEDAGSPAFGRGESEGMLHGLVRPVGVHVAMLLPTRLIEETVTHAQAGDGLP